MSEPQASFGSGGHAGVWRSGATNAAETSQAIRADALDDYLGLLSEPLDRFRCLLFHGASGSGKSSQIALLLARHSDLTGRQVTRINAQQRPPGRHDIVAIDELRVPADALSLLWARRHSRLTLVASHLEPHWLRPLLLGHASATFRLDGKTIKLERHLKRLGVSYSSAALQRFTHRFGANYTDLEIVLEAGSENDLDRALARFSRAGRIEHGE